MARTRNPRTLLDRATAWSPVLLLGALAGLTYWLDAQVQPPIPRLDGSQRHDPDIVIENFRGVTLDTRGRPSQSISGKRAAHFADDNSTEVDHPMLAQTEAGKPAFRITAEHARLSGDREQVQFRGKVRASRDAGPATTGGEATGPILVTTESLLVIPKAEVARTDQAVTIEEPRGIIRAVGLELNNKARTLHLKSAVSGTLQPQSLPK